MLCSVMYSDRAKVRRWTAHGQHKHCNTCGELRFPVSTLSSSFNRIIIRVIDDVWDR